jgi:hypothetical protein
MAEFATMAKEDYGIKCKPTTAHNPQANAVIERIHQTIGNIIWTFQVQDDPYLDEDDPFGGILAATRFAARAMYHTTLQATPMQLVMGRDAILNVKHEANWKYIRDRKQKIIAENNKRENAKRINYNYRPGQKVLLTTDWTKASKYGENPYDGPYDIVKVNDNGTVRLKMGSVTDTINIRRIKPYHE